MNSWPLWRCLKPADQAAIKRFQLDNYGEKLDISPAAILSDIVVIEESEELEKIMRQKPKGPRHIT